MMNFHTQKTCTHLHNYNFFSVFLNNNNEDIMKGKIFSTKKNDLNGHQNLCLCLRFIFIFFQIKND